jgi:hypothetical protein
LGVLKGEKAISWNDMSYGLMDAVGNLKVLDVGVFCHDIIT